MIILGVLSLLIILILIAMIVKIQIDRMYRKMANDELDKLPMIPNGYVTIDWLVNPMLSFDNGHIYPKHDVDVLFHPEYFIEGQEWPVDPITKEKLSPEPLYYREALIREKIKEIKSRKKTTTKR